MSYGNRSVLKDKPNARVGASQASHVCFQRQLREEQMLAAPIQPHARLVSPEVKEISPAEAKPIILKYEWLGTMGRSVHCVGLFEGQLLLGVVCFGWPASPESRDICGKENRHLAIALERGACVHYAPKNAGSYLVTHACRLIAKNYGYRIFYAYSDEDAGEIGTIYQACNWLYIGQGVGRSPGRLREYFETPDGVILSSRALRHRGLTKREAVAQGWKVRWQKPKHKYVVLMGNRKEKASLRKMLRYPTLPYPKRFAASPAPILHTP